jgi:hypothetical protein
MTEKAISPLRRRLIEDMTIRRLSSKTQYQYIRHVKKFADFLGRSADKATTEDVHRYQLWLAFVFGPNDLRAGEITRHEQPSAPKLRRRPGSAHAVLLYRRRRRKG